MELIRTGNNLRRCPKCTTNLDIQTLQGCQMPYLPRTKVVAMAAGLSSNGFSRLILERSPDALSQTAAPPAALIESQTTK